jgi:hypothetical protein
MSGLFDLSFYHTVCDRVLSAELRHFRNCSNSEVFGFVFHFIQVIKYICVYKLASLFSEISISIFVTMDFILVPGVGIVY